MSGLRGLKNALETLELPVLVSYKEIKSRYHELVKRYHPDIGGDAEQMGRINSAYKELKEYIENYRFSFSQEEYDRQHPGDVYAARFKF